MSGSISFSDAIRSAAAAAGRSPTPQQVAELDAELRGLALVDIAAARVTFFGKPGQEVEAPAFIADAVQRFPVPESTVPALLSQADRDAEAGTLRIGWQVMHGRHRGDWFADITRSWQASDAAALDREAAAWPNPWRRDHENRTKQTIIQNVDPARAAILKAEAGR